MREIKFRAKRIDNNKWAYGGLVQADDYCIIDQQNELYVEREYNFRGDTHFFQLSGVMCDKTTIGQFTGLKDKSGKEMTQKKRRQFVLTTLLPFKGGFIMIWKGATLYYP